MNLEMIKASGDLSAIYNSLDTLVTKTNKADVAVQRHTKAYPRLAKSIDSTRPSYAALITSLNRLHSTVSGTDTRIKVLQSTVDRGANAVRAKNAVLNTLNNTMRRTAATATSAGGGMSRVTNETQKATAASKGLLLSWQSLIRLLTIQVLHQAVSLLSMALRRAADDAKELQLKLAEVRAISDGVFLSIQDWGSGLRAVAEKWGTDLLQLTEAAYQTVSNQIAQGEEAIKFVESASRLAMAAVGTQTDAVQALSSVINAYKLNVNEAESVSAKLFETIKLGRLRLANLGQDLGQVTPIAAQLGVTVDELLGSIASLTRLGMSSSEAVTQMRNVFLRLLRPTDEMRGLISDLGFASGAAMIKTLGLAGAFKAMQDRARGSLDVLTDLNPRIRGMAATMEFTERRGLDRLQRYIAAIEESATSYQKRAEEIMETNAKQWDRVTTAIKTYFLLDVGPKMLEMLVKINKEFVDLTKAIKVLVPIISFLLAGALVVAIGKMALFVAASLPLAVLFGVLASAGITFSHVLMAQAEYTEALNRKYAKLAKDVEANFNRTLKSINDTILELDTSFDNFFEILSQDAKRAAEDLSNSLGDSIKDLQEYMKHGAKELNEYIKEINSSISSLQSEQEKIQGMIRGFQLDADKMMFQFILDDADIKQKFDLWTNRIKKLREEQAQARKLGDSSEVDRIGKEINQALLSQRQIQQQAATQNQKIAEKRLEITQKIRDLEQQMFRTSDRDKRQAIDTDISGLRRELEGLKILDIPDLDIPKKYREYTKDTITILQELKQKAHAEELKRIEELAKFERRQDQLTSLMKKANALDLLDLMQRELPKDERQRQLYIQQLKRASGEYSDIVDQTTKLFNEMGIDRPESFVRKDADFADFISQQEALSNYMKMHDEGKEFIARYTSGIADATDANKIHTERLKELEPIIKGFHRQIDEVTKELERVRRRDAVARSILGGRAGQEAPDDPKIAELEQRLEYLKEYKRQIEEEREVRANRSRMLEEYISKHQKELDKIIDATGGIERAGRQTIDEFGKINYGLSEISKTLPSILSRFNTALKAVRDRKPVGDAAGGDAFGGPTYGSESRFMTPGEMIMSADSTRKFFNQYMTGNSSVADASGSSVNIGDINITMQAHGNVNYDAQRLGNQIRREIRQGMLVL